MAKWSKRTERDDWLDEKEAYADVKADQTLAWRLKEEEALEL